MATQRVWLLAGLGLCLSAGCSDDDGTQLSGTEDATGSTSGSTGSTGFAFEGIELVRWDGADGLEAEWLAAAGPVAGYRLSIESVETGAVTTFDTTDLLAGTTGLAEGEYRLWVEADDGQGTVLGADRVLTQLIGENRLVYRSELPYPALADVWGEGDTIALAGYESGFSFVLVDISDVTKPEILVEQKDAGEAVWDIKLHDDILYVPTHCLCQEPEDFLNYDGIGIRIFDVADPMAPVLLSEIGSPTIVVHNVTIADDLLFAAELFSSEFHIYDISNPSSPSLLSTWAPNDGGFPHDMEYVDGDLYVASIESFAVLDVRDPTIPKPTLLSNFANEPFFIAHNIVPSKNPNYLFLTMEGEGGHLTTWDVSDPMNMFVAERYSLSPSQSTHNLYLVGDYGFLSYYWYGVRVLDVRDPTALREVGWYDTLDEDAPPDPVHSGVGTWVDGNWGVWPYGKHVAISDMRRGLILLDHFPEVVTP